MDFIPFTSRWLEPLQDIAFENDSEAVPGIRIEFLERVQAFPETARQHLPDAADLLHGFAIAAWRLLCRDRGVERSDGRRMIAGSRPVR
jgi:hypothetical protein